ncbi:MAG: IMPACT family protein [Bacteroidota bacterium]
MNDRYSSIQAAVSAQLKVEGSRFIAGLFPVETEQEAAAALELVRKKYFDATHHCYAHVIGAEKRTFRYSDDGEPSGTAGIKIYAALQSHNLSDILCVVTRYFGGTKLGVGGLGRAYHDAAAEGIRAAVIVTKSLVQELHVQFLFTETNPVMNLIHAHNLAVAEQTFSADGTAVTLLLPSSGIDEMKTRIVNATRGTAQITIGGTRTITTV